MIAPRRFIHGFARLALVAAGLASGLVAQAAPPPPASRTIAVTRPAGDDPIAIEAAGRLVAELAAAGLNAAVVPCAPGFDRGCAAADAADAPDAAVAILRAGGAAAIEVRIAAGHTRTVLVRRVDVGADRGADDPSVLAIRAVELVRATLMQPPAASATAGAPAPAAAEAGAPSRWGVALGAVVLQSLDGFGAAFGPEARLAFRPAGGGLGLELALAVPAVARDLVATEGTASLQQQAAGVGVSYALPVGRRVIPIVAAGGGVYHVQVTGHAVAAGTQSVQSALWAAQLTAAAGAAIVLGRAYAVRVQAAALFAQPAPYVTIGAADPFHAGRPLLLFSVALERGLPELGPGLFR